MAAMTRVFCRDLGYDMSCWVEIWSNDKGDFMVVSEATVKKAGNQLLIDTIRTIPGHERQGYASKIIERLKAIGFEVAPIGVLPESKGFWDKHGMQDALGEERES